METSSSQISSRGTRHVSTQAVSSRERVHPLIPVQKARTEVVHSLVTSALPEGLRAHWILPQTGISSTIYRTHLYGRCHKCSTESVLSSTVHTRLS